MRVGQSKESQREGQRGTGRTGKEQREQSQTERKEEALPFAFPGVPGRVKATHLPLCCVSCFPRSPSAGRSLSWGSDLMTIVFRAAP